MNERNKLWGGVRHIGRRLAINKRAAAAPYHREKVQTSLQIPLLIWPTLNYYNIDEQLSVIYLPTEAIESWPSTWDKRETIGLAIQIIPLEGGNNRPSIIIPVDGRHLRLSGGVRSLAGACVCHRCLQRLVREAETEGIEKITYLHSKVNKLIYLGIKEAV